ncbi:Fe-S cluster assembly protein SufD [Candidatus Woesearchaeota archaeon]|nr:Fe-S cluster assembly protein SufD [Candidatus Woesearchaeota archaeon]
MGATKHDVEMHSKKLGETGVLLNKRLNAMEKLEQMPPAMFKHGLGIITSFEIDADELQLFSQNDFEIISSGKAIATNFAEADEQQRKIIADSIGTTYEISSRMIAMHTAFLNSGILVQLPKNADSSTIHIKLKAAHTDFSHILVIAEEGSKATIIEEISGTTSYRSGVVEIIAKANSEIMYAAVQKLPECKNFSYKKAVLEENANVEWLDITTGSSATKAEVYSELKGDGSKTSMFSVFFGNKQQQYDLYSKCTHIGRNTSSEMHTSGALKDKSKAVQQGFAKIEEKAYNAAAHQKSKILLLSEDAKAVPTPKLEIDNNEVAATHQAAVGQIDYDKIFYLMSRGISEKEAKKVFVEGFFEQYASKIPVQELREEVQAAVAERMQNEQE